MDDAQAKRFLELAQRAWNQGTYAFTNFLDLAALTCFYQTAPALPPVPYALFGGAEGCERKVLRLGNEGFCGYDQPFPIACLKITPVNPRFAEPLTHRDFLGALMALGVQRELLGDIIVRENETYLFCLERIADYIAVNFTQARHTALRCQRVDAPPAGALFTLRRQTVQLSSERLDALVAHVYKLSRSDAQALFPAGKIFVDGRLCENTGATPKAGQIISVRGFGRFRYQGLDSLSKKGKSNVVVELYV